MKRTKLFLTGLIGSVGALIGLGLAVSPFDYGLVESAIVAGGFVLAGLFHFVLSDALATS